MLRALPREELRLLPDDGADVDQVFRDRQLALLEALDVEEVVDERPEPAGLRLDDAEVLAALLFRHIPLEENRCEAEHARERCPELVSDDADELRLRALAFPKPLVLILELAPAGFEPLRHPVEGVCQL